MGKLIQLDRYKGLRKRDYLKKYDRQISKFIDAFLDQNLRTTFEALSYQHISHQQEHQLAAWDYVDFRDTVRDGFHEAFGAQLLEECKRHYWFDERFMTEEVLVDRCVSHMILGPGLSVAR